MHSEVKGLDGTQIGTKDSADAKTIAKKQDECIFFNWLKPFCGISVYVPTEHQPSLKSSQILAFIKEIDLE